MFITFYSYKGGVGRTLALANVACLLAQDQEHPQRVLLWDFDLEAPGLHRLFPPAASPANGFVSLLYRFAADGNIPDIGDFIYQSSVPGIDVLAAGRIGNEYCTQLQALDWPSFFGDDPTNAGPLFSALLDQLREMEYDYIFIDSRTGLTDQSSVCTQVLSDLVIIVFRLTDQNLDGLEYLVPAMKAQLHRRCKRGTQLVPLASEVPSTSARGILEKKDRALKLFQSPDLRYIRFDQDLVGEELLPCLKSEYERRWPIPPIVEDYRNLCAFIRGENRTDTRTATAWLHSQILMDDMTSALGSVKYLLKRRPQVSELWGYAEQLIQHLPANSSELDTIVEGILAADPSNSFALEWKATQLIDKAIDAENGNMNGSPSALVDARDILQSAIERSGGGGIVALYRKLANVLSCIGDLDGAVNALRECGKRGPGNAQITLDIAHLHIRKGYSYFGSAIEELEQFPEDVESTERYELLAFLRAALGDKELALQYFSQYSQASNDRERNDLSKAHMCLNCGEGDKAVEIVNAIEVQDPSMMVNVAEFFICAEKFDRAMEICETPLKKEITKRRSSKSEIGLKALASYLKGGGTSEERVLKAWCDRWRFTELLMFRERIKRRNSSINSRLNVIERLVRQDALRSLQVNRRRVVMR